MGVIGAMCAWAEKWLQSQPFHTGCYSCAQRILQSWCDTKNTSAFTQEFFHMDLRDVASMKRASKDAHFSKTLYCGTSSTHILAAIRNL